MKAVFIDTDYLIALLKKDDPLHTKAVNAGKKVERVPHFTSEMVLTEFLNIFAKKGRELRAAGVLTVGRMRIDSSVHVVAQTSEQFEYAFSDYSSTTYSVKASLTDISSFHIMQRYGLKHALTHDGHFESADFIALMRTQ